MWEPELLTEKQKQMCMRTISPNTFYMIVGDAIKRRKGLSVVRMGEGEVKLHKWFMSDSNDMREWFSDEWIERIGLLGISKQEALNRFIASVENCDYFSPSISGIWNPIFDLYNLRNEAVYVDNFFINFWTEEQKVHLYKEAGHVVILHANKGTRAAFKERAEKYLGVHVDDFELSNWSQSENIIEELSHSEAALVIFSGGPGSKYIGPELAKQGKVVLDVGNSMDAFILYETWQKNK